VVDIVALHEKFLSWVRHRLYASGNWLLLL
jgi:hypothetical protein